MFKIIIGIFLLLFSISPLIAGTLTQDFDAGSNSDSDEVHSLAHFGAGVIIVSGLSLILDSCRILPPYKKVDPLTATLVEIGMAVLVDEAYEIGTNKTNIVSTQHDIAAGIGSAILAVRINYNF